VSNPTTGRASILREDDPTTWEPAWQSEAVLRAEFDGNKDVFLAAMRNHGKVRSFGSRRDLNRESTE
jgi:hypothetical protein